jgi:hypothetical protein
MAGAAGTKSGSKARILPECATLLDPYEDAVGVNRSNRDVISEAWLA